MGKASRLLAHEVPGICYDSSKCHSLTSHQLTIQMNPEGSLYFLGCPEAEGSPVLSLHVSPLPGQSQACKQEIFRNQAEVPQNYSAVRCREKEKLRHPTVFLVQKQPFSFRFRWCSLFCQHWENLERARGWIVAQPTVHQQQCCTATERLCYSPDWQPGMFLFSYWPR